MAIFFSCCPWQISHNVRVAPAPSLDKRRIVDNNTATSSKPDLEMLKNNENNTQRTRVEKVQLIPLDEESSLNDAAEKTSPPMTGHCFKRKTFRKPTYCHHCSDLLWGLTNQGLQCSVCGYVTHERCQAQVVTACNIKASSLVQIPRLHTLVDLSCAKRRFCNVCRRKIDDQGSFKCVVCPYYVHGACEKLIVNNCKITATATSNTKNLKVKQQHHWTEGHLPVNSKCASCTKACSSTDCLTGLRCSWCLTTVHSYCVDCLPVRCDFGSLRGMVLPPFVVKDFNPNTFMSQAKLLIDCDKESLCESRINGEDDGFVLRIHEGPIDHPHTWRNFMINKATTTLDILQDAYKKFHIKEDKTKYYLTRLNSSNVERKLEESDVLWTKLDTSDSTLKQVFLRHVKLDTKSLKIVLYAGAINTSKASVKLKINIMAKAREIIKTAMEEFQLKEEDPSKFCITQMKVTSKKVKETYISDDHSLYEVLVEKRKQTIAGLHSTRFYLQTKEKPESELSLFVGNLPSDLSPYQYKYLLGDIIGKWNEELMSIQAIFPIQGALVIRFLSIEFFLKNIASFKTAQIEGKTLSLRILPEIKVDLLPAGYSPLLVFVNSKSGGGQGSKLLTTFKRLLNPYQVVDLLEGGPLPALYVFRNLKRFRILICGGDGTFGWVLSSIDEIRFTVLKCTQPPSALLPLGTGNDLARVFNWGSGYHGESVLNVLTSVSYAAEVMMDRWNVVFDCSQPNVPASSTTITSPPTTFPTTAVNCPENGTKCDDPIQMFAMNNYFGVGIDAHICLEFHLSREENPEKFNNRLHNKGVYVKASLKNLKRGSMSNIQDRLILEVDGQIVQLPSIEGIAITNISSWGAGADPWGKDRDEKFEQPSYSDGILEVIGFTGVYHMGKIQGGLSTGIRIAQGAQINMTIKEALPVQIDGEPWLQPSCRIMIRPCLQQARMLVKPNQVRSLSNASENKYLPNHNHTMHDHDQRRNTHW